MSDFSRFTPAQVHEHLKFNQRSVRLQPQMFDTAQRSSLDRAARLKTEINAEIRAFEAWRATFLTPRRDIYASADADTSEALASAHRAMERLQRAWNAVQKVVPRVGEHSDQDHA
ncbi:hypothetical protein KPL74_10910 [Bacillus sp. NP157]|nr:hypothetical protein KPL74_10910 [Bacillus sp. NP157]